MASTDGSPPEQQVINRPYHAKRPHRKSRAGCRNCKTRKVKCDEVRPTCRNCTLRKEECKYDIKAPSSRGSESDQAVGIGPPRTTPESGSRTRSSSPGPLLLKELLFLPSGKDEIDMKCLWFYTTKTHSSLSTDPTRAPTIEVLRTTVVQLAFEAPFLMDTILSLTAQHMKYLGMPIAEERALAYRAKAFQGYRRAIEEAKPESYTALLPASLFMCAVASVQFREKDTPPLYILDWILVWRGIGLMFDLVRPETMFQAGMDPLFFRPAIDLNTSALHIPSNLLFMVTSMKEGDEDFPNVEAYYDTLKYLGALYKELLAGFSAILDLRIITFFTFLRRDFIDLARSQRPRALVIVAHYLAFAKTVCSPESWWMFGISDRDIDNICNLLDEEWASLVRVPRAVARMRDRDEIAKTLLNNHAWEPNEPEARDDVVGKLVDDSGKEIAFKGRFYQVSTRERPVFNTMYGRDEMKNTVDISVPATAGLVFWDDLFVDDGGGAGTGPSSTLL